jgi:hypothetical protein
MFCFYFGFQSLPSSVKVLISMLLLHNCLFGLNVFTELGTKLLFLLIKKNAYKDKHQKVASQASVTSSF